MTDKPIAKPSSTSDKRIFEAHAQKIHFVNPPGAEYFASTRYGEFRNHMHAERRKVHGMEKDLSVKGRPVT